MTTLRQGVYATALADTTLKALLAHGAESIFGADGSPPPATIDPPWLYLGFGAEVRWGPWHYEGRWTWRAYDVEQAGYTRINTILNRLQKLYVPTTQEFAATVYYDSATKEDIWKVQFAGLSGETADQGAGLLQRWADWVYRKTYRTDLVAS